MDYFYSPKYLTAIIDLGYQPEQNLTNEAFESGYSEATSGISERVR